MISRCRCSSSSLLASLGVVGARHDFQGLARGQVRPKGVQPRPRQLLADLHRLLDGGQRPFPAPQLRETLCLVLNVFAGVRLAVASMASSSSTLTEVA